MNWKRRLPVLPPELLPQHYAQAATTVTARQNYKYLNPEARQVFDTIRNRHGTEVARIYLRAVLCASVEEGVAEGRYQVLPPLCRFHHFGQLQRIIADQTIDADWIDPGHDLYQKEFGIVSLRLYACGSNLVDPRCGISKSLALKGSYKEKLRRLVLFWRIGGFRPFFQGHMHLFNREAVNLEGRRDFYRCCVELSALYPKHLGFFCSSWYYDPVLETISPRLEYLRNEPLAGGAHLLFVADGGAGALDTSPTRRRLHAEGTYKPKTYMIIWDKEALVRWAKAHPRTAHLPPVTA